MDAKRAIPLCLLLCLFAQTQAQQDVGNKAVAGSILPVKKPYYLDLAVFNVRILLPEPPAADSAAVREELTELHRVEQTRTAEQIAQAREDENEEDIFIFKTVLGNSFTPEAFPVTAALGGHMKNEQSVVGAELKHSFARRRPYQVDPTLHPVCAMKSMPDSYPSGHALTGYLEALTLADLLPEKRSEILARADEYAYNRIVCGVHYPSDLEASRRLAYAVFGYILSTPKFRQDTAAAEVELRQKSQFATPSEYGPVTSKGSGAAKSGS
jgi:acid phosphatase (class A)